MTRIPNLDFQENLYLPNRWTAKTPFGPIEIRLVGALFYVETDLWANWQIGFINYEQALRRANHEWKSRIRKSLCPNAPKKEADRGHNTSAPTAAKN